MTFEAVVVSSLVVCTHIPDWGKAEVNSAGFVVSWLSCGCVGMEMLWPPGWLEQDSGKG